MTTDASQLEMASAERILEQSLGDPFNDVMFSDADRNLMIRDMAQKINFYSRRLRKDQSDPEVIQRSLADVVPRFNRGNFFGMDDPSFSALPVDRETVVTDSNGVVWEWNGQEPYESQSNWKIMNQ